MKILAVDTTQEVCSVAISVDGEVSYREELAPRTHTQLLLPQIQSLLDESELTLPELDALAYGRGPGSFTGLRIASGVVQGLALGSGLPVIPVSSLAAMAQGIYRQQPSANSICCAFDARINEVYWGCYQLDNGIMRSVNQEQVSSPESVILPDEANDWWAVGSGWLAYPVMHQNLSACIIDSIVDAVPLARDILPISIQDYEQGLTVGAEDVTPVYLRHKVAQTISERTMK